MPACVKGILSQRNRNARLHKHLSQTFLRIGKGHIGRRLEIACCQRPLNFLPNPFFDLFFIFRSAIRISTLSGAGILADNLVRMGAFFPFFPFNEASVSAFTASFLSALFLRIRSAIRLIRTLFKVFFDFFLLIVSLTF